MRKTISTFVLLILILNSCSPARTLPTLTGAPTALATAKPNSQPTATSDSGPTKTPSLPAATKESVVSYAPLSKETFTNLYGDGGEENLTAIMEWVKSNWNLGEKDKVTVMDDSGFVTISIFDEETGKRNEKFYSLATGEARFDTRVAENYEGNNWQGDPEWEPTPLSRVTVMGHVDGLNNADGTPMDIPISIGAGPDSDIKRIVPSQVMADALARGYLEAYKARFEMQTGQEVSWEEYLSLLKQGKGVPTVPQPNDDATGHDKYTKDSQINPLAGVAIVYVDGDDNNERQLPVKVGPGFSLKYYIDEHGRLVVVEYYRGMNYGYAEQKAIANNGSNFGGVSTEELFATVLTAYPARNISSSPDSCLHKNSFSRACNNLAFAGQAEKIISDIYETTIEARKQGVLIDSLLIEFRHTIPPYVF